MSYPIVWTEKASDEYVEILKFLDAQYGVNVAMRVYDEVERVCDLIASFPELYQRLDDYPDIRRAIILKKIVLLYYFTGKEVEIRNVFDARSDY
ncbi:MAG: type II toxin-antitoxin system RelE/ParE family toxin [Bacteroidota bacterium]